jgi:ribosomal subunit interface protein
MNIIISGLHFEIDPQIKEYVNKKVGKLSKYNSKIQKIDVRLASKKSHRGQENDYFCEIEVVIPGHVLEIVDSEREIDKAIDRAVERMKNTLVRNKEKHTSQKHKRKIWNKFINRFRR